jgi:hypothetical protein
VPDEIKRVCVVIGLANDSPLQRIAADVPSIIDTLRRASTGEFEALMRSSDGILSGFLMKTDKTCTFLRQRFEECKGSKSGDSFIAFEVGQDFSSLGFTRAGTWLQRH